MATPGATSGVSETVGRIASWPALAVLGLVLPLIFLTQVEDYLYYFRAGELLPAYGTAFLFLALLMALPTAALWLALPRRASAAPSLLARVVIAVAITSAAAALLYSVLVWMQSFGWLTRWSLRRELIWLALAAGIATATSARGYRLLPALGRAAKWLTLLGAGAALAVPFSGWHYGRPATAAAGSAVTAANGPPHILLLTIDALSAEHMSLYGAARDTTPMLSSLAQGALTFDRAYANANFTTPGVASILTGTRPWTHRALQLPSWPDSATRKLSLPALLQQAGYQTAYVSTNAAAGASKNGLGGYFDFASRDRIHDLSLCTDTLSSWFKYACPIAAMPLFSELVALAERLQGGRDSSHYDPRLATAPALKWLQRIDKQRPVFLWVHLFPPHSPYAAPAPWLGSFDASADARHIRDTEPHWGYELGAVPDARVQVLSARYDESVAYADYYAGEFLQQALQLLGDNTVVVVTADHGESFRHGYGAHTGPGLFDEIIRVPLIIRLPHQTLGAHSAQIAEQVDIAPTLAQLAGVSAPSLWEGRSLLNPAAIPTALDTEQPLPDKPAFSMNFEQNPRFAPLQRGVVAVISGRWKLVHYLGRLHYPRMPVPQDALFDLFGDPAETTNLAASQPQTVARLQALIDAQLAAHGRGVFGHSAAPASASRTQPSESSSAHGAALVMHDADEGT
jgi:arylsulfatase A-like enzyme